MRPANRLEFFIDKYIFGIQILQAFEFPLVPSASEAAGIAPFFRLMPFPLDQGQSRRPGSPCQPVSGKGASARDEA